ncbi:polysaccharide pyruvyl transferase family protein [Lonepinella sp. BR2271]|uniref:polysaccharide pyruvyl transferase family protein n=1 Tax=Lonepinella sp. BR2271 TaxID=3434550 RepID=UPI003F6DED84
MNEILQSLKQHLQQIDRLIIDKNDVLYFDYPLHLNVGDLLIYAGTEQFFKDYHIHIRLRRCLQAFDLHEVKKYIQPNTTILCHGGGNFGDLYPLIQQMREEIVREFPHNRIILLPQTAHFSSEQAMLTSATAFSAHPDLHLFARDSKSMVLMQQHFSQHSYLSPDMAHQLYGILPQKDRTSGDLAPTKSAVKNTLYFLRKDIEKSHIETDIQAQLASGSHIKDWEDLLSAQDHQFELWCSRLAKMANKFKLTFLKNKLNVLWYQRTLQIIARCQDIFLSYDDVITSRLHGHIFSCLLGIPNQVCDNSYGKNSGYYQQWTKDIDYTTLYEK